MTFEPAPIRERLRAFWALDTSFGVESFAPDVYLLEMVSDRNTLTRGFQLIRDDLHLAHDAKEPSISANAADLTLPSALSTLAHSNCGDRVNQGRSKGTYEAMVGNRFGTLSERGHLKLEAFYPTGGGTDDGATLAHVTVRHAMDGTLRERLYGGNPKSFLLVGMDLKTHVGRMSVEGGVRFGLTRESEWREPRAACGAIVGTLTRYNADNPVHRRVRRDLGEENFQVLSTTGIRTEEGCDVTTVVAAAILCIRGVLSTAEALRSELGERGVGHLTASVSVNQPHLLDTLIYVKRATVFEDQIAVQGLGLDATRYGGHLTQTDDGPRLNLSYDGIVHDQHPVEMPSPNSKRSV